jgi:hypothetical protein
MKSKLGAAIAAATFVLVGSTGAIAGDTLDINGAFSIRVTKPEFAVTGHCPAGTAQPHGECGSIDLLGLGTAAWNYNFGPTFVPTSQRGCFMVDGTFSLTLQDHSFISGPLTGTFCSPQSGIAFSHVALISYGGPFHEDDTIALAGGTGRFVGYQGTVTFHTFGAGALFQGTLTGSLAN